MNAVILAGGFGKRLKPLTDIVPKPMLNMANVPMLDHVISGLKTIDIRDFNFTLGYKPEQIIEWAIGYRDVVCHFSIEDIPLGTCGGVKAVSNQLDDVFIVVSGDGLCDIDYLAFLHRHYSSGADITMAVTDVANPSLYGVVEYDPYGFVTNFVEKPKPGEVKTNTVNCGIYVINKKVLDYVPDGIAFDFSKDLFPQILKTGKLAIFLHEGYWCDIGDIGSYYKSNFYMKDNGIDLIFNDNREKYSSIYIGDKEKSMVSNSAHIVGNCSNCIVGHRSNICSGAALDNCIVLNDITVRGRHSNCIIGDGWVIDMSEYLGQELYLQNSTTNSKYIY